jgi:hypothetical protein
MWVMDIDPMSVDAGETEQAVVHLEALEERSSRRPGDGWGAAPDEIDVKLGMALLIRGCVGS